MIATPLDHGDKVLDKVRHGLVVGAAVLLHHVLEDSDPDLVSVVVPEYTNAERHHQTHTQLYQIKVIIPHTYCVVCTTLPTGKAGHRYGT